MVRQDQSQAMAPLANCYRFWTLALAPATLCTAVSIPISDRAQPPDRVSQHFVWSGQLAYNNFLSSSARQGRYQQHCCKRSHSDLRIFARGLWRPHAGRLHIPQRLPKSRAWKAAWYVWPGGHASWRPLSYLSTLQRFELILHGHGQCVPLSLPLGTACDATS